MSKAVVIETQDLTKKYDGVTVVDHLNLRIEEGEIFGLLGPNGAGKTTTILMLLGLTEPASGMAQVCGFNPTREPLKVKRLAGYMPERIGFYDDLTAGENLRFIADLNNISYAEANKRIEELLKIVGLAEVGDLTVGKFSRGMRQRLGIADALVKNPRVVFLDEATAGLDPAGINEAIELIASLPKMGTTVVFCSHRLYEVQKTCHRVGMLSKGKLVAEGSVDELSRRVFTGGRYRIEAEIAQTSPQLVEIIRKIDGVKNIEVKGNLFTISTDIDLRAEIAKTIVQSNAPLLQMKIEEFSLDEIYMKYFREGLPER